MNMYDRIKMFRIARGMSQEELAKKVGYKGRSAISKVENGERDISQSMIKKYASALGVAPEQLLWDDEQEKPTPDNEDELDMAEVVSRLSNEELYDLLDAVNKRLRELNR